MSAAGAMRAVRAEERTPMSKLIKGGIAGLGAWKLGGGIIGTIIVFLLLYWLLSVLF